MLLTNFIVLRSIFRGTQVPKVRVSFRADWKRRETETVIGERLRAMDKLHRQSTERIDAVTLRVQERPLGVREVIAGEKVCMQGEREDDIGELDGVDASECNWGG